MDLENKTVVITGASKGLGKEMAIYLSRQKAHVILVARTEALLQNVQEQIEKLTGNTPLAIACDISSEKDVDRMAAMIHEKVDHIDVLINNAGFGSFRVSENISNQEMRRHFAVNFFGAYYCIKALLPLIKKSTSGYILNVGSLFSRIALAQNSVYAATKYALAGFTEGLRRELKPLGIHVGFFMPGPINTSFHDTEENYALKPPEKMILDPKRVAVTIGKMVRRHKKKVTLPVWMMLALKIRFGQ